jgi:hypothetical protein
MKKDELQERDGFINSLVDEDPDDLEQTEDIARAHAIEEDRLLRDEEEAKSELPR